MIEGLALLAVFGAVVVGGTAPAVSAKFQSGARGVLARVNTGGIRV